MCYKQRNLCVSVLCKIKRANFSQLDLKIVVITENFQQLFRTILPEGNVYLNKKLYHK